MARKGKKIPEINAASMADIAFLLLIFFLLVTTIDTDKGIIRKLPPMPKGPPPEVEVHDRNVLVVRVNAFDQLMVEGDIIPIEQLRERTKEFILNPNHSPDLAESPQKAIVSLKNDRGTSYDMYIQVQNELTAAYNEIRDEYAMQRYGKPYDALPKRLQKEVRKLFPMKISEAEPEQTGNQ